MHWALHSLEEAKAAGVVPVQRPSNPPIALATRCGQSANGTRHRKSRARTRQWIPIACCSSGCIDCTRRSWTPILIVNLRIVAGRDCRHVRALLLPAA